MYHAMLRSTRVVSVFGPTESVDDADRSILAATMTEYILQRRYRFRGSAFCLVLSCLVLSCLVLCFMGRNTRYLLTFISRP
jgi:hypothetical protein